MIERIPVILALVTFTIAMSALMGWSITSYPRSDRVLAVFAWSGAATVMLVIVAAAIRVLS